MKKILLIIIAILSLFTTGCFDYRELNDLIVTTAIGINYENEQYSLTLEVIDTTEKENRKFYTCEEKGITIQEAFRNLVQKTSKKVYGSHIDLVLISDKVKNINEILDFFYRDMDVRNEFEVVLVNDVKDVIGFKSDLTKINSKYILELLLNQSKKTGIIKMVSFNALLSDYLNKNKEIILPFIEKKDDSLNANKMAVFKDNQLKFFLEDDESKAYNFATDNISNTILTPKYNDEYYSVEILGNKTKVEFKNNIFYINIRSDANLTEIHSDIDITKNKNIQILEETLNDYLKSLIYKTIEKYRENDIIPFNIKEYIYKNHYDYYKTKTNFDDINIKVNVDINIVNKGEGLKNIYAEN